MCFAYHCVWMPHVGIVPFLEKLLWDDYLLWWIRIAHILSKQHRIETASPLFPVPYKFPSNNYTICWDYVFHKISLSYHHAMSTLVCRWSPYFTSLCAAVQYYYRFCINLCRGKCLFNFFIIIHNSFSKIIKL